jgi:hypothetical protein
MARTQLIYQDRKWITKGARRNIRGGRKRKRETFF